MYTIKKASELLGVSKVTVYKHMEKNGINKGTKLEDKHIALLKMTIAKNKDVNGSSKVFIDKEKDLTFEIRTLELENKDLKDNILKLELENRKLMNELQVSQVLVNETQKQNIELMNSSQKLLENKKAWWKR